MRRVARLTLCAPALFGLAAAPAQAQSIALNGAATATISGSGTTTTGSTTFGGGANTATSSFFFVNAYDASQVTLANGGSVTNLNGFSSGGINVTGGNVTNLTTGNGLFSASGGTLGTVDARSSSAAAISGGNFTSLTTSTFSSANTTISGGGFNFVTFDSRAVITGGDFGTLNLNGPVNVFGTNLSFNGVLLTGTLLDGEAIDARVTGISAFLSLNNAPVPEASTTVSFGLLLALGLGGLVIAARRKKAMGGAGSPPV